MHRAPRPPHLSGVVGKDDPSRERGQDPIQSPLTHSAKAWRLPLGPGVPITVVSTGDIRGRRRLSDHLVGAGKQRGRNNEAERISGLQVDECHRLRP